MAVYQLGEGAAFSAVSVSAQLGRAGEEAAGLTGELKNTERIESETGARYRVPDGLDHVAKELREAKNVARQGWTKQLRDFLSFTEPRGYTYTLTVRKTTYITGPLQRIINAGKIVRERKF